MRKRRIVCIANWDAVGNVKQTYTWRKEIFYEIKLDVEEYFEGWVSGAKNDFLSANEKDTFEYK